MLDFDTCNAARLRRDPAYDGLFFTAVKTTRISNCPNKEMCAFVRISQAKTGLDLRCF